jgi:cyclic beta-1,2-glucan glucanotransferase
MPFDWSTLLTTSAATLAGATVAVLKRSNELPTEAPFRAELLSREELVQHARSLAATHEVSPGLQRGQPLLRRIDASAKVLFKTFQAIVAAARGQEAITPAAEWLLDNFHIVEEQLTDIRKHLPRRYYGELPKLRGGSYAGYPRVYALALELIAHSDGALDEQSLKDAIHAYQEVSPLSIGELWAVAIMLRVGLVENLRRLTAPLVGQWQAREKADAWAERLIEAATNEPGQVTVLLGELARERTHLTGSFFVRMLQRLRGRGLALETVLEWLDSQLLERGTTAEELIRQENQAQAADQISVSNTITSFRLLASLDWPGFFESASLVEEVLRQDPAGVYAGTDFETRDACRHVVERIAKRCRRTEIEVAGAALQLAARGARGAERPASEPPAPRAEGSTLNAQHSTLNASALGHIAYYLIDDGCRELERRLDYHPPFRESVYRFILAHPTPIYLGSIGLITAGLVALAGSYVAQTGAPEWLIFLAVLLTAIPASELAVGVVNKVLTLTLPPRVLPKCELRNGVPPDCRTLVVIPTLLTSEEGVDELLERLEVHYLANEDPNLHFALLTDYADAPAEERPGDLDLLHRAIAGILSLNERYEGQGVYCRFFLFHRRRQWNPGQGCWMGWERKRGKLVELNRLLQGAEATSFTTIIGDRAALEGVRYILCLDTDTRLPREAARRLIGTLAHPLNRPLVDPERRVVVRGYGILQPRVSITLTSAALSLFTRIFSGNAGVDPYTTAISDVYQDLFGEGIFCGKGIYDLHTFQQVLEGRVADNTLLSHDLFEGSFARCGLVSDIELFDDYPARYNTYSARQHRWVRGDWQLLPWLAPRVRQDGGPQDGQGSKLRNPLTAISRWKIIDNMRRSLVAPALVFLLAAGWLVLPGPAWGWTLAAVLVVAFPIYAHLASALFIDPRGVPWTSYFWRLWDDAITNLEQSALSLVFLAHQAYSMVDAVCRTLWRMFFSRRNLLEWQTAAAAERQMGASLQGFFKRMGLAPAGAVALLIAVLLFRRDAWPAAAPLLLAWALSPWIGYWVSLSLREEPEAVTEAQRAMLRQTARKTWRFFQDFITPEDHWLPPDNYQEDRVPPVAHRTSPTNIGLLVLSTLSARDLGYTGLLELADRLERTLWNVAGLERYRGHLYNWYDTISAAPTQPFYVSTVDSGNLAGHLLTLKQGCEETRRDPVFGPQTLDGLWDTFAALRAAVEQRPTALRTELKREWEVLEQTLKTVAASGPSGPLEWQAQLTEIHRAVLALNSRVQAILNRKQPGTEAQIWKQKEQPAAVLSPRGHPASASGPQHYVDLDSEETLNGGDRVKGDASLNGEDADISGDGRSTQKPAEPPPPSPTDEADAWCGYLLASVEELQRDLDSLLPWARLLAVQPPPFGDGRPLTGDLSGRPHVFARLIVQPPGCARGLADIPEAVDRALLELEQLELRLEKSSVPDETRNAAHAWLAEVRAAFDAGRAGAITLIQRFAGLGQLCERLLEEMDFSFLYDHQRDLFAIGYNVPDNRLDHYHYDLLASECRLASLIAIGKREVPQKHWFRMGRQLTPGRERALVSWTGTMFEYMMPLLVMRAYEGTLLAATLPAVVHLHQRFAARHGVPWGISESGYNARDPAMNYQYRAFGVPGLGLRPDLYEDLVVAPYATLLALPVAPRAAARNLEALTREGLACRYGFYEAIDYTPTRLQSERRGEIVRSLMAHHQGMSLVSLANYLLDNRMQALFHADPLVKATELLLEERNPREAPPSYPQTQEVMAAQSARWEVPVTFRHFATPHTSTPRAQVLSNGRYSVMVTNAGGGYSAWKGLAVTRWREDVSRDHWGMFVYLRDMGTGDVWSGAFQPVCGAVGDYDVDFTEDKAEFRRLVNGIISRVEIAVSPEDDVEVRRVTLTNTTEAVREVEVTSYAEVVMARPAADLAHQAFSNLFVETEFLQDRTALLATRRPRSADQARQWAIHVLAHEGVPAEIWAETRYETDRARFIGRGRSPGDPIALSGDHPLANSTGPVLDPIFSLRQRVRIQPHATVQLAFTTGAAATREEALHLAQRYHDLRACVRAFDLAWTHSQVELRHLGLSMDEAHLCQRLASRVLYVDSWVRPPGDVLARNTLGQSGLWAYGISGDLPIVLAQVSSFDHIDLVRQLLVAHEYLRLKGLAFDLVIVNEHPPSYLQAFEQALQHEARNQGAYFDQPGGVFLRRAEFIPDAGRNLLLFVARAVFSGANGSLSDQLNWRPERKEAPVEFEARRRPFPGNPLPPPRMDLAFFNGLGGFSEDGNEYVVLLDGDEWTPAPWINVLANERFGCLASEAGSGYTWSENSRENRLTPWWNDPVGDGATEMIYLRHEDTGRFWSITPLPVRESNPYIIRHGPGYSRYEHISHGLEQELLVFVPPGDPVKIFRVRLRNHTDRPQRLSTTFFAEWVLGVLREQTHPYVAAWHDTETGALLARNTYNGEFAHRIAFADVNRLRPTWTADRTEFLGRNGSHRRPRAMYRVKLSGTAGVEMDPCAALQVKFILQPGAETEVIYTLGAADGMEEARELIQRYRHPSVVEEMLKAVREQWAKVLETVRVKTPDPAFDLLLNRWLLYQVLACRVWARSALYQSGGAFGFRDQLQDVMALAISRPDITRRQILLHASRQFVEGDVQHWWHPPTGRGVRTRFSDDLLWLPYVTIHYLRATGDRSVLNEQVPFLHGRPLAEGEDEYYDQPTVSDEEATVYEHCLRAIRRASTTGAHGLPLMGSGDWNDGMNQVGHHGRGESVWVAWFLIFILQEFAPLCDSQGDAERAAELRATAERYRHAVEENAWDGEWYRRAYFDDGTPLGSKVNEECRIDAIAQSWAVISGAGKPERARRAMESVEKYLVREEDELILLFTPPFDKSALNPGYIKGYVPGIRENGGQYTHAALWTVMATALLGQGDRAYQLYTLLNPIHHGDTAEAIAQYRVEPYVVAADVYGVPPHTGRGGWTWYTGSASWMYRIGLEVLLGFHLLGDAFTVDPCIPRSWPGFEITYTRGDTRYHIVVANPDGVEKGVRCVTLDGQPAPGGRVPLTDDGSEHQVRVVMG